MGTKTRDKERAAMRESVSSIASSSGSGKNSSDESSGGERMAAARSPFIGSHTPANIALYAFALGNFGGFGLAFWLILWYFNSSWWALGSFFAFVALLHLLEYVYTAVYNPRHCSLDSFLINHSTSHRVAITLAVTEFCLECALYPRVKEGLAFVQVFGVFLTIAGQTTRSMAMHTAGKNFSHRIATHKAPDHQLVTSGIYSILRHPSYTGFYYWAIGTQLVLLNPITLIVFLALLAKFFGARIEYEEATLIRFFGEKYEDYRKRTKVFILY